ncbi:hypothetical protein HID58_089009 [Brassica napus]|uniref:Uncharacterized protein n=1 Tax=Brassica napus TaxID=3708 RepID=A0ABQ7XXS7_BRANA|nr:hypothetical protein HID58_089009 [Brassica napus]
MAGLLAWAADVVGKNGKDGGDEKDRIPLVFTEEQQKYVDELGRKAATLSRSIQDLRLRLPPSDISQRLPHLHAHSLASNAALTLQLDSHSATREQAQAEGIVGEIHSNEMELERLNTLWRRYESFNFEGNAARNRFKKTNSDRGFGSDHEVDAHSYLPYSTATRTESQTRLMYLRSAFVVYILALHVLVFIKISF